MANKGFFIITDISGYTEYLTGSELDHANEILQSLFDAQLNAVEHPFLISGFRGDAIFMYVPETNFVQSQSFIEALENFYEQGVTLRRQNLALIQSRDLLLPRLISGQLSLSFGDRTLEDAGATSELVAAE